LEVTRWTDGQPCAVHCDVVDQGTQRDFWGWNRAKHAVLEAAILCTRLHILPRLEVQDMLRRLASPVMKTGGDQELAAWKLLTEYAEGVGTEQ